MIAKKRKMEECVGNIGKPVNANVTPMYLVHAPLCVTCVP